MDDLISRSRLIFTLTHEVNLNLSDAQYTNMIEAINHLPSVQPEYDLDGYSNRLWKNAYERGKRDAQAERKKGEWISGGKGFYCSECSADAPFIHSDWGIEITATDFCPNCGADMREESDEK